MAWVFKSLWDFAAGDWQEGQVYRGFSLVTGFRIRLHSSSSKGPSSWQPPSLPASAGMPVAGRRMRCVPRPATQPHCHAGMAAAPAHQVRPPSDPASATLIYPECGPEVLTRRDAERSPAVSRSHSWEYGKNRACWIQVSFFFANRKMFQFWNWVETRHSSPCSIACLNINFNRSKLHRFFAGYSFKRLLLKLIQPASKVTPLSERS